MFRKNLLIISILALFLLPTFVYAIAVPGWPLVPCGLSQDNPATTIDEMKPCGRCDLFQLLKNLIDFVTIGLMPPLATLLFVWGGFLILLGGATPSLYAKGQTIFRDTFYGIIILLSAWMITNTLILSIGAKYNNAQNWWQYTCTEPAPVGPPAIFAITTISLPSANLGQPYNQTIQVTTGGTQPFAWTQIGSLPAGLSFNTANGTISGIPTTAGKSTFTIRVTDASSPPKLSEKQFSITVGGAGIGTLLSITTSVLSDARQDFAYSQVIQATGGSSPYNWSIAGSLPSGLIINSSTGEIFGTPTVSGNFTFTVAIQDSSSPVKSATRQLTLKIVAPAASVVISNIASSNITQTNAVITWTTDKPSTSQVAHGTTTAYGQSTSPDNSQVTNHQVAITGLSPGTIYNYQVISSVTGFTARSSNNTFKTVDSTTSNLTITASSLPDAAQNQSYTQILATTGGIAPYNWTVSQGSLPAGLSLDSSSGIISGIPTTTGTYNFTVRVTDNSIPQQSATKQLSIVVGGIGALICGQPWEQNLCQPRQMACSSSACGQYALAINQHAGGAVSANLLKAIMMKESSCNIGAINPNDPGGGSCGLMQLQPLTANIYKSRCGISENVTCSWLTSPSNASASICIAAEYIRALSQTTCGSSVRNLAAGYNGGGGACKDSRDCTGETSCAGGSVRRWECLYDNPQHTVCNTGPASYVGTRDYATKVLYCYNNPGF